VADCGLYTQTLLEYATALLHQVRGKNCSCFPPRLCYAGSIVAHHMGKNLLNHTTEIPVEKTIGEIQQVLVKAHATSILTEYDNGAIKAIMFKIKGKNGQELPFRLPAKAS
jgi:hypothetical protein